MSNEIAGTKLTYRDMHTIIRSGGNFSVEAMDLMLADGPKKVTFDPPYKMEMDVDYAFQIGDPSTTPALWQIEQIGDKAEFRWVREADRAQPQKRVAERTTKH